MQITQTASELAFTIEKSYWASDDFTIRLTEKQIRRINKRLRKAFRPCTKGLVIIHHGSRFWDLQYS